MRQLYCVLPDLSLARQLYGDPILREHCIGIRFYSEQPALLRFYRLPKTHLLDERDIGRATGQGALLGLAASLLTELMATQSPVALPGMSYAVAAVLPLLFGTWVGGLVGVTHCNYRLAPYRQQLRHGQVVALIRLVPGDSTVVRQHLVNRYRITPAAETCRWANPLVLCRLTNLDNRT